MKRNNLIKATGCILALSTVMTSSGAIFAETKIFDEKEMAIYYSKEQGVNFSKSEYEQYLKENVQPRLGGKFISIKKRYESKDNIPAAVNYTEYKDGYWWGGVLKQVGSITIDKVTGHYLAVFEGKIYKQ